MFDEQLLRELASVEGTGPILSVYLNVDSLQQTPDAYKLILRDLLKQVEDEADSADIDTVKRFVDLKYDWTGRGLVFFSREADDIWYQLSLAVPVRSGVTVARRPYISPLVELDGLYGRFAVALIDQQGARFFLFQMGELVEEQTFQGEEVRGARKGMGSSRVGMRGGGRGSKKKAAEIVQRNLRGAADALAAFCRRHKPRRLLLAGAEGNVAHFRDSLPAALSDTVVGTFTSDMDASVSEILEHALEVLQELGEARKEAMVDTVITAAAKGGNGVIRLGETLSAANQGRIQVLVIERGYHEPGYECSGCGYLTTQELGTCPFCGAVFKEIPDAAEAVVTQVVEKGGTVQVVDDGQMGQAKIGALLRY
jgi:peptide chain release factor subunit 1